MNIRSTGVTALYLLLLLTSLLDAAGHELLCRDEPVLPGIAAGSPGSWEPIASEESEEDEKCPCCGLVGPRISFSRSSTIIPSLTVAEAVSSRRDVLLVKPLPTGHLSRGPPAG